MVQRDLYMKEIIPLIDNELIKVITGIRRCGKSYLLFNLYYDYLIKEGVSEDCIISVPLDDDEYAEFLIPEETITQFWHLNSAFVETYSKFIFSWAKKQEMSN